MHIRLSTARSRSNLWLPYHRPRRHTNLRLFCFPNAGAGASVYRAWQDIFPPEIEVLPVQLPGRENRFLESPALQLEPLIQSLADALLPCMGMSFAFFGHSMGAIIAFELTRTLRKLYQIAPIHLFASACHAPHLPYPYPILHQVDDEAFVRQLHERYGGIPKELAEDAQLMQFFLPTLRADFTMIETYTYSNSEPLNCPITALGGEEDFGLRRNDLEAWQQLTQNSFELYMFHGDHFYLHHVQRQLAQLISRSCKIT